MSLALKLALLNRKFLKNEYKIIKFLLTYISVYNKSVKDIESRKFQEEQAMIKINTTKFKDKFWLIAASKISRSLFRKLGNPDILNVLGIQAILYIL